MPHDVNLKLGVRLTAEQKAWLAERAHRNKRSMNAEISFILERLREDGSGPNQTSNEEV